MFYYELCFDKSCVRQNSIILSHESDLLSDFDDLIYEACKNIEFDASLPNRTNKIARYLIEKKGFKRFSVDTCANVDHMIELYCIEH